MHYTLHTTQWVQLILVPMTDANSVTAQIFVKAWSIYEQRHTNGLSHVLEHLFFKGGKRYPTPKAVATAIDAFGGEFNAYTSDHLASYYVKCAPGYLKQAVDVLSDMMINARFPAEELEREKQVIIQEMKMIQDSPQRAVASYWKEYFYGDNPYGRPVIGSEANVLGFSSQDLFDHQRNLYTKDNLIIVVAGKISSEADVITMIGDLFGDLPDHALAHKPPFVRQPPVHTSAHKHMKTQQNHLIMSAVGFNQNDDRRYAARLLSIILGGNMSSRLFQHIREQLGVCYYIGASHASDIDDGVFMIRSGIDKTKFEFTIDAIHQELSLISKEWVSKEELEKAKGFLTGQTLMGIESSDDMAEFVWEQRIGKGKIESLEELMSKYHHVNISSIMEVIDGIAPHQWFQFHVE